MLSKQCIKVNFNKLTPKYRSSTTKVQFNGTRSQIKEIQIFKRFISKEILEFLTSKINKNIALHNSDRVSTDYYTLFGFIGLIIQAGFKKKKSLKDVNREKRNGKSFKYERDLFTKYLHYDEQKLF